MKTLEEYLKDFKTWKNLYAAFFSHQKEKKEILFVKMSYPDLFGGRLSSDYSKGSKTTSAAFLHKHLLFDEDGSKMISGLAYVGPDLPKGKLKISFVVFEKIERYWDDPIFQVLKPQKDIPQEGYQYVHFKATTSIKVPQCFRYFPFQITIPKGMNFLPPSFSFSSRGRFTVGCRLELQWDGKKELISVKPPTLSRKVEKEIISLLFDSFSNPIEKYAMLDPENIEVKVILPRKTFYAGDQVSIKCIMKKHPLLQYQEVIVSLKIYLLPKKSEFGVPQIRSQELHQVNYNMPEGKKLRTFQFKYTFPKDLFPSLHETKLFKVYYQLGVAFHQKYNLVGPTTKFDVHIVKS